MHAKIIESTLTREIQSTTQLQTEMIPSIAAKKQNATPVHSILSISFPYKNYVDD